MASSASAKSICKWTFDAFICFNGDYSNGNCTSELFVIDLKSALDRSIIHSFIDHPKLYTSHSVPSYILNYIKESRFIILVISNNYTCSPWFMRRLVKILNRRYKTGQYIFPVLYNLQSLDVNEHLNNLAVAANDEERVSWVRAVTQLNSMTHFHFHNGGERIFLREFTNNLRRELDQERDNISSSSTRAESTNQNLSRSRLFIKRDYIRWIFLFGNLILEILSAVFNQFSSPNRPGYAFTSMVISYIAVIFCTLELFYIVRMEKAKWGRRGGLYWLYSQDGKLFGSFIDIFGVIVAILQCIFSTIEYSYFCNHSQNPIKLSVFSVVFATCVACSKVIKDIEQSASSLHDKKQE